ncbi:MAG: hypothetical protein HC888_01335 [Candidatus Competibacteraceae bacterium]|nr:hypothetical protein [Candidatus Competibacteraceae bacterium]
MPFRTETYQLEAFQRGEVYSASTDRRRFLTIDNQLAFLSDRVGDGRIGGWTVFQSPDDPTGVITVEPGMGVISRQVTRTLGELQTNVAGGRTVNIYIKRRNNVIGGFGPWSNLSSVVGIDVAAPSHPRLSPLYPSTTTSSS